MTARRQPLVLLDTNAWVEEHLLTTSIGSALTFYLSRANGRVVLPEVVEEELLNVAAKAALNSRKAIRSAGAEVARFTITLDQEEPTVEETVAAVRHRLAALGPHIRRFPLNMVNVRAALHRVLAEKAPNSGDREEFRDSLLWTLAISLSKSGPLSFVTNDGDFFNRSGGARTLRPDIYEDVRVSNGNLTIYQDTATLLAAWRQEVQGPSHEEVAETLAEVLRDDVQETVADEGFEIGEAARPQVTAFRTGAGRSRLALSFEFRYPALRASGPDGPAVETTAILRELFLFAPPR